MEAEQTLPCVVLVDDHPVVRQGLAALLGDEGFNVVATASTFEEALDALLSTTVDILVVDLVLEHGSGLEVLVAIRSRKLMVPAVVYSVHEDSDRVRRSIEAGARGYVSKREDPDVLLECLRRICSGERFLSPRAARAMADAVAQGPVLIPEQVLSPQEMQVYSLTGHGHAAQEIGARMGLSVRTVETYYGRILDKLGIPGRRELRHHATKWALREAQESSSAIIYPGPGRTERGG